MRKKRESYVSYDKEAFLNQKTGAVQRLDNTAWYLKKKMNNDGEVGFFLNLHTKFQQMPNACFAATAEKTPELNVPAIQSQIKKFMEIYNESN